MIRARRRREAGRGIFGVDARFDRVTAKVYAILRVPERLARGDANLLANQVEAGDHFGHGVLDLDARVHFQKVELVAGDEALDRSGGIVADRLRGAHAGFAHRRAHPLGNRGGRLLPEFLMAPLQRAVALADVHDAAVLVGQHLQLDVLGILEIPLGIDRAVFEIRLRLAPGRLKRGFESRPSPRAMRKPLPPPPEAALNANGYP